ncbi:hypothetical protein [Bradyrhizobium sp. 195]|nr:hypothetical protein IVB26_06020 [Bradyrhizobium sp. 195]
MYDIFNTNIEAYEREEIAGANRELPLPHVEALTAVARSQTQQPRFRSDGSRSAPFEKGSAGAALFDHAKPLAAGLGFDLVDVLTGGVSDGDFTASRTARLDGLAVTARRAYPTMSSSTFR